MKYAEAITCQEADYMINLYGLMKYVDCSEI